MSDITHEHLRKILKYDPETGQFRWLSWKHLGKIAGHRRVSKSGRSRQHVRYYWEIRIGPETYKAHRLAWFYMTGEWPKALIDHKDCDGLNNRWTNLREADFSKNTQNSRCRSDNACGLKGVHFLPARQKWRAKIKVGPRRITLGSFATPEAAHAAYEAAAIKYFGEFARAA